MRQEFRDGLVTFIFIILMGLCAGGFLYGVLMVIEKAAGK